MLWIKHFCIMKQRVSKFGISASFWDLFIKNDGKNEDYLFESCMVKEWHTL